MILALIFNVCMHLNECDDEPLCVCRLTTWRTMPTTRHQTGFWRSTSSGCSGGCCSASQRETSCRGAWPPGLRGSPMLPSSRCPRSAGAARFWQLPTGGCVR
jgi:hypothetical protein